MMTDKDIKEAFKRWRDAMPEPKSDLEYTNAYTLLVAVALSAQSTDAGVNKATKNLFTTVDTPQKMIDLGEDGLKHHIKTIGLYNTKAKNIIAAAHILMNDYNGQIPNTRADLVRLPGVGRKTANVVLNIIFGQPTMAVDTHIFRVANRMNMAPGKNPHEVEKKLVKRIPDEFMSHAHHWLILHGRYTCKARTPDCANCIVYDLCQYADKTA